MRAKFEIFKAGGLTSVETLCKNATSFVTKIGPDDLISLTQGMDRGGYTIIVWYWDKKRVIYRPKQKSIRL